MFTYILIKNIKIIIAEEKSIVFLQKIDRYPQDKILRNLFAFFAEEIPLWVLQRQLNTLLVSSQGIRISLLFHAGTHH